MSNRRGFSITRLEGSRWRPPHQRLRSSRYTGQVAQRPQKQRYWELALTDVLSFAGNQMADSTSGFLDIACSSGNQMNVTVKDCLTGNFSAVDSYVETLNKGISLFGSSLQFV